MGCITEVFEVISSCFMPLIFLKNFSDGVSAFAKDSPRLLCPHQGAS